MKTNWQRNKEAAKYRSNKPTMTDQASARDTDINVIVAKYTVHGQAPGAAKPPEFGQDYTAMPNDYRGMIEMGRDLQRRMKQLPKELQHLPIDQLLALTPEQLKSILAPPAQAPATPKEEGK